MFLHNLLCADMYVCLHTVSLNKKSSEVDLLIYVATDLRISVHVQPQCKPSLPSDLSPINPTTY